MDKPQFPRPDKTDEKRHSSSDAVNVLSLKVLEEMTPRFFPLLQRGFELSTMLGCSLHYLLIGQLGLDPEYVSNRLSTIFLDGKPVDDLDSAIIDGGMRLALSAAMPGLVGATMRRGGQLASLRGSITYREEGEKRRSLSEGYIHVKLFNLVMTDLGPLFLRKGIVAKASELAEFFESQPASFLKNLQEVVFNGKEVHTGLIGTIQSLQNERICIRVSPSA